MRFVIQRVRSASVSVNEKRIGHIERGFFVLIGVADTDTEQKADKMVEKMLKLRIFEDEAAKTNRDINHLVPSASSCPEVSAESERRGSSGNLEQGALLLVSQFTLYADCRKGKRPSFFRAGEPGHAEKLYQYIIRKTREILEDTDPADADGNTRRVQTGQFGADMQCSLVNDGPFTIILDSEELGF